MDDLYFFKHGKVLFKPTKAKDVQFRKDKKEFISYFIGSNNLIKEDKGFALEPWKSIYFKNFDFAFYDNIIFSMGNYFFTDLNEEVIGFISFFGIIKILSSIS